MVVKGKHILGTKGDEQYTESKIEIYLYDMY